MAVLSLTNISKSHNGPRVRKILVDINMQLHPGEYVAIMGESGVGKSTLLNLISGLDSPDSGTISFEQQTLNGLDDNALTRLRREKMGFVFQAFHVLPHLTLLQNVALPLSLNGVPTAEATKRATEMLHAVGLNGRESGKPRELSGGELQRVAIARALVHKPRLLLADEPTGNLDPETAARILALLRNQLKQTSAAGILVTHSMTAAATTDKIFVLNSDGLQPR